MPDVAFENRSGIAYYRFSMNGKNVKISSNVKIYESKIELKTGIVLGKPTETQIILSQLDSLKNSYKDCILNGNEPSLDYLKSQMFGRFKKELVPTLTILLDKYFEHNYGSNSLFDQKTIQKNGYMLRYAKEWVEAEFPTKAQIIDIKPIHAEKLMNWVITDKKVQKDHARRCVGFLDRALKFAVDSSWIPQNSFQYILEEKKFQRQPKDIIKFLTDSELITIENVEIKNPDIAKIRDWFVCSCHIGTAWDTFPIMRKSWIKTNESGTTYMEGKRGKPNGERHEPFIVPLNDKSISLLEKFIYQSPKNQDYIFEKVPTGQHVNTILKEVSFLAGVNKPISFNWGRKTFATRLINAGVRIEIIAKMMGHTSTKTTLGYYAKVNLSTILNEGLKQ